jgi:hypothetical protein
MVKYVNYFINIIKHFAHYYQHSFVARTNAVRATIATYNMSHTQMFAS